VVTGLKQGDALSPLLFNIALEKVVRSIQKDNHSIDIGTNKIGILGFANDLNIVTMERAWHSAPQPSLTKQKP